MKILIDLLHIRSFSYAGIYIVAIDIVKGLLKYSDYDLSLLIWDDQEEYLDKWIGQSLNKIKIPVSQKKYLDSRFSIHTAPSELLKVIKDQNIDIIFTTCYTINSYIFPKKYKQVGFIHDMQPFRIGMAEGHRKFALYWLFYSIIYYRKLRYIITNSKNTSNEVKRFSFRNSTPIYLNLENTLAVEKESIVPEIENRRYILDVNSFMKYKNTERLIMAFAQIKEKIPHLLYLKGYCSANDQSRYLELTEVVKKLGLVDRVIIDTNNRSQSEMLYLFRNADLFVSPSLLEGFGLTPVEAIIHKCTVLVSNINTLVEVTDNKVGTFDPLSVDSIAEAIISKIKNPSSAQELDALSEYFKEKYSLKKQIKSYIDFFNTINDGN